MPPQGPPFDRHSREPTLPIAARAFDTIRGGHWWGYKIPPLLAVVYAGVVVFGVAPGGPMRTAQALLTVLAVAAYGFVLNDLTDIEADRLSGQPNRMAGLGVPARATALLLPLAAALALAIVSRDTTTAVLTGANLLLPTLYSVPPVRLKGRGALGALADTSGVHILPMALVAWAVTRGVPERPDLVPAFIASAIGWTAMLGLRGIVVHQAQGLDGDRAAQVRTFVASLGRNRARRLVWRWIVPVEVVALLVFLVIVVPRSPVLAVTLGLFAALEFRQMQLGWTLPLFEPPGRSSERYRPLVNNAWYELWLPLALAVQVAFLHRWGWAVGIGHLVLFHQSIFERVRSLAPLFRGPLGARAGGTARFQPYLADAATTGALLAGTRIVGTVPAWIPRGATWWTSDLVRGLVRAGVDAQVVLTEESTPLVTIPDPRMRRPQDIPVIELPVERNDNWGVRWAALGAMLEGAAPSVLILTDDWRHSAVVPVLDDGVIVVGVVLTLDPLSEEQVLRLRGRWDLLVGGSPEVSARLARLVPELASRIATIPHGLGIPADPPSDRGPADASPRVLVTGTASDIVVDTLRDLLVRAKDAGTPWEVTLLDPAGPLTSLTELAGVTSMEHLNRLEWIASCRHGHAFLALDWNDDRARQVVEAMGHGVIPITWDAVPSGAPFRAGSSGRSLERGDDGALQEVVALLGDPVERAAVAAAAHADVVGHHYTVDQMVAAFIDRVSWSRRSPRRRETSLSRKVTPPPAQVGEHRIWSDDCRYVSEWGTFPDEWSANEFDRAWRASRDKLAE